MENQKRLFPVKWSLVLHMISFVFFIVLCLSGLLLSGLALYEKSGERWQGERLLQLAVMILFLVLLIRSVELFLLEEKYYAMKNQLSAQEELMRQQEGLEQR